MFTRNRIYFLFWLVQRHNYQSAPYVEMVVPGTGLTMEASILVPPLSVCLGLLPRLATHPYVIEFSLCFCCCKSGCIFEFVPLLSFEFLEASH